MLDCTWPWKIKSLHMQLVALLAPWGQGDFQVISNMSSRWYLALGFAMYWGCNCLLLYHLLPLQNVSSRVRVTCQGNITEDGLSIDSEVRDPEGVKYRVRANLPRWWWSGALAPWSLALAPCFVNTWLCNSWDHIALCMCVMMYPLGQGPLLSCKHI